MNLILQWFPWIPPLLLSGIFNLLVAYQKLYRDFRSPFFNPWLSFGFWLWVLIQLGLPALVFCFYGKIFSKPTVDFSLYWTAIQVGFFSPIFVNADADLGFTNFPVDKFYAFFNDLADNLISAGQTGRLADFTVDLKQELQRSSNLDEGLDWLKGYFQRDFILRKNPEYLSELVAEVERALEKPSKDEKVNAAIALIFQSVIRPKDYPKACRRFGCSQKFLQDYFQGR
jgi:hypothetical protein